MMPLLLRKASRRLRHSSVSTLTTPLSDPSKRQRPRNSFALPVYNTAQSYTDSANVARESLSDVETQFAEFEQVPHEHSKRRSPLSAKGTLHYAFRPPPYSTEPSFTPQPLEIRDGVLHVVTERNGVLPIPGRLLRDICSCAQCRNPATGQRQINVFQMHPEQYQVRTVYFDPFNSNMLHIVFADGHEGICLANVLAARNIRQTAHSRFGHPELRIWDSEISKDAPRIQYSKVGTGDGMRALLSTIRTCGFVFVANTPSTTPDATEKLLQSIGPIRNTHYGGFYDFTSDLSSKDTAYTAEALEPHTDNTYFTEPAGLQALHMLSHTDGSGGESSLVDGFNAAAQLFSQDKEAYKMLSLTGVFAHASGNEGIGIQPANAFPTFGHQPETGYLNQVRWNNADRAGTTAPYSKVDRWYEAAGKLDALLNDPKNQYWFQLQPGTMLIYDNWRVLHGRAAFTGQRRMCGGYINRDDYISKYRMTNLSKDDISASTVTG